MPKLARKAVEVIEDLPLSGTDRWYVLLACLNLKHSSWLTTYSEIWREGEAPKKVYVERLELLKQVFDSLGLHYRLRYRNKSDAGMIQPNEGEGRRRYNQIIDILISHTQAGADELYEAVESGDDKRIGYALDFPRTAVEEFDIKRGRLITEKKIKAATNVDDEVLDAMQFIPSKNHYTDEIACVGLWLQALKDNSTIITSDLYKSYK